MITPRMHLKVGRASWRAAEIRKLLLTWEATCGAASCMIDGPCYLGENGKIKTRR